jgi:CRISPR-associated endoribonuclease Cas6
MIRKILILKTPKNCIIEYNYEYDLLKEIYRIIQLHDFDFGKTLHEVGYEYDKNKHYKFFNHLLLFDGAKFYKNGISLNEGDKVKLIISGRKEVVNSFIAGLMKSLGVTISGNLFEIKEVVDDKKFKFERQMLYKLRNLCSVTILNDQKEREDVSIYNHQEYFRILAQNIMRKYKTFYGKEYEGELYFDVDDCEKIKRKSFNYKKGFIKGYVYDLWIEADVDMQKIAYYCGIGENNAVGAGFMTHILSQKEA